MNVSLTTSLVEDMPIALALDIWGPASVLPTPSNTVEPVVSSSGGLVLGETLSCTTGTWGPTPDAYTYRWYRGAAAITGATSATYEVTEADQEELIRCRVTAVIAYKAGNPALSNQLEIDGALTPLPAYYFKAGSDSTWETLENWWSANDGTGEHPATIPWATEDTATFNLGMVTGETTHPICNTDLGVSGNAWSITGTCTIPMVRTYNSIWSGTFVVSANNTGGLELDGSSTVFSGTSTGYARFYGGNSSNAGTITGDALFDGSGSYNYGTINGNVEFASSGCYNSWGHTINGNAEFKDNSVNGGTVTGTATFSGMYSHNEGTVTGNATFSGQNSYNHATGILNSYSQFTGDDSHNDGTVNAEAYFQGYDSYNNGEINGPTTFYGSGSNNSNTGQVNGNAFFMASTFNDGGILGNATVYGGGAEINGSLVGNLTLHSDSSYVSVVDLIMTGTTLTVNGAFHTFYGYYDITVDDVVVAGHTCSFYGGPGSPGYLSVADDIVVSGHSFYLDTYAYSSSASISADRLILLPGASYFWGAVSVGVTFDIYCEASDMALGDTVYGNLYITSAAYGTAYPDGFITEADTNWTVPSPWPD